MSLKSWEDAAKKLLVGRKIVGVRYMTDKEASSYAWFSKPIVLVLDNGVAIFPSKDDEGNDGGALFTTDDKIDGIPVVGRAAFDEDLED